MDELNLLPTPRELRRVDGRSILENDRLIVLDGAEPDRLLFTATRVKDALRAAANVDWALSAVADPPPAEVGLRLRVVPERFSHDQAYELVVSPDDIVVEAGTPQGVFYGAVTLIQLLEQAGASLPCLRISDRPDFVDRGVMLDVSRDKVPTMETLYRLVDRLASWKINQLQLYTEHTFAYRHHPEVWAKASPLTGEEILRLDAYCRERFIELVPNQNSFGHMQRWLTHERYAGLAELHGEFTVPWGTAQGPFSLSPVDPGSIELIRGLFDELLPHFTSRRVNVGCDETFDLGQGRSKQACAERGVGRVYLDFLLQIHRDVSARGFTMQFWGDIIEKHPELIPELPEDAIALGWGYEADHPFASLCEQYAAAGVPFYVCPGTSSWCSIGGRSENALGNLRNAAENGLRHGALGYLITDWGDLGHWQVLPVSHLGFVAGAAYSWAWEANRSLDVVKALSWHAFGDPSGRMGRVAYRLGDVHRRIEKTIFNATPLFWIMQGSRQQWEGVTPDELRATLDAIDEAVTDLAVGPGTAAPGRDAAEADLVRAEFANTARLLRHACRRGLLLLEAEPDPASVKRELATDLSELVEEYRRLWLARNRPGGLDDSVARFEPLYADYRP